jgi:hypothetical protein
MRRLLGIMLLLSLNASVLPATICAAAPEASGGAHALRTAPSGTGSHGPAVHAAHHEHAGQHPPTTPDATPDDAAEAESGRQGPHGGGCALMLRCHWSAVPAGVQQPAGPGAAGALDFVVVADAVADALPGSETPPPKPLL